MRTDSPQYKIEHIFNNADWGESKADAKHARYSSASPRKLIEVDLGPVDYLFFSDSKHTAESLLGAAAISEVLHLTLRTNRFPVNDTLRKTRRTIELGAVKSSLDVDFDVERVHERGMRPLADKPKEPDYYFNWRGELTSGKRLNSWRGLELHKDIELLNQRIAEGNPPRRIA